MKETNTTKGKNMKAFRKIVKTETGRNIIEVHEETDEPRLGNFCVVYHVEYKMETGRNMSHTNIDYYWELGEAIRDATKLINE